MVLVPLCISCYVTVNIEAKYLQYFFFKCIIEECEGEIDLNQWKQGNTCFRFIFKGSHRDPFFFQK